MDENQNPNNDPLNPDPNTNPNPNPIPIPNTQPNANPIAIPNSQPNPNPNPTNPNDWFRRLYWEQYVHYPNPSAPAPTPTPTPTPLEVQNPDHPNPFILPLRDVVGPKIFDLPKPAIDLFLDKSTNLVVLAVVGKGFIDYLIGILSLPIGGFLLEAKSNPTTTLIKGDGFAFGVANLRNADLQPRLANLKQYLQYPLNERAIQIKLLGTISRLRTNSPTPLGYARSSKSFFVTDDLAIHPYSVSNFTKLVGKSMDSLEMKRVFFGEKEAMALVKEAMRIDTVLTRVFLHNFDLDLKM